jgi:hypothetical protein
MILTTINVPDCVPEGIRGPLGVLTGEAQDLRWAFLTFQELYNSSSGNIPLLNLTAPKFFLHLKSLLFEHLLVGISRLTDPPGQGSHSNLTFCKLFDGNPPSELLKLEATAKPLREIRNKIGVHLDLQCGLDTTSLPNKGIYVAIIESVTLIQTIIDLAWQRWTADGFTMCESDAPELLSCLKKSLSSQ